MSLKNFFLVKLLYLFFKIKINFKNPKKEDLIIFDDISTRDLKNILINRKFIILRVRYERLNEIFLSLNIIFFFLKYIKKNFYTSYLAAIIKVMNPKIVLTTIDNSNKFHDLAKIFRNDQISFIAIQNAARYDFQENEYLFKKKKIKENINKKYYIPNYYCFGDYEEFLCKKYKINVKSFFKYGSLRLSNYIKYKNEKKIKINKNKYDIALISEVFPTRLNYNWPFYKLVKFVIEYCIKNDLKFIFITKKSKNEEKLEIDYLKKNLNKNEFSYLRKHYMKVNFKKFKSYLAIEESNLVIGCNSTMLRDKLTLGGKILSYNYTGFDLYKFPVDGICLLKDGIYSQFEKRVKYLLSLSNKKFFKLINSRRIMFYNKKNLTFDYINKHIDKILIKNELHLS